MAEFGFTEAQGMFRAHIRNFTRRELMPTAKERVRLNRVPGEVIKKLADTGFLGLRTPEKYGGQMSDLVTGGIACEETARSDIGVPYVILLSSFGAECLALCPEEVQAEWMPRLCDGERIVCLSLTEPDAGSDAAAIKARAVKDGDHYVLNGEKTAITLGMQADVACIFLKTDTTAPGAHGITGFLVPLDLPGIERSAYADMGHTCVERGSIFMDNVRLPTEYRIGDEGKGFYVVMGAFDWIRVYLCLHALGQAQQSIDEAIDYAKQRKAFNRPIAKFEAVSFRLVDSLAKMEAARLLCYKALWLMDHGLRATKETAMAKSLCPAVAIEACNNAMLTFGHAGYSSEHIIEQRLRDVYGYQFADGTADIQRVVMVRDFIGREYLSYT